ncbi:late competence development ComFB family protein [Clostridium sp. ZS2-4]|uniref:late competence development ComFB family protein n=1 Tax=Clostridium sp. ZS2-4 TaxID=2987703 RepID=UPI00227AE5AF|nr:late competence development ComFB family protein [Clostridium sp. ZS2-4]MCY6354628.1 late competence development ComFB family protein [Clostridium sp. ZS2-4]
MYSLKNYSEELVDQLLPRTLQSYNNICKCKKCTLDIKAYALNSIKPKYVVSEQGEIYTRVLNEINKQEMINIVESIMRAIEVISKNPRH